MGTLQYHGHTNKVGKEEARSGESGNTALWDIAKGVCTGVAFAVAVAMTPNNPIKNVPDKIETILTGSNTKHTYQTTIAPESEVARRARADVYNMHEQWKTGRASLKNLQEAYNNWKKVSGKEANKPPFPANILQVINQG
ncbi:MAG: hypothetical protein PHH70_03185 [Candidatus Gracilibacteria bacterium]|nr:hypothetical protein [Candidatus Gracilibacteria bacterium]